MVQTRFSVRLSGGTSRGFWGPADEPDAAAGGGEEGFIGVSGTGMLRIGIENDVGCLQ